MLRQIEQDSSINHSIFSPEREDERNHVFQDPNTKIILAWGKNKNIKKMVKLAFGNLPKQNTIYCLKFPGTDWGCRHPFPMFREKCIEWLEDMGF